MSISGNPRTLTVDDLIRSIRQEWRLLTVTLFVVLALAIAAGFAWPSRYEATAVLTVSPLAVVEGSDTVNMETERVIASSVTVMQSAVEDVPGLDVRELESALNVTVPKGSQVLEFTVSLPTGERAAAAANAVAEAYSAQRVSNAERVVEDATATLTQRITTLETQLESSGARSQEGRAAAVQIQALQESLASLNSATFSAGTVVGPASVPSDSTRPSLTVFAVAGIVAGALLGSVLALFRSRARESARSTSRIRDGRASRTPGGSRETRRRSATLRDRRPSRSRAAAPAGVPGVAYAQPAGPESTGDASSSPAAKPSRNPPRPKRASAAQPKPARTTTAQAAAVHGQPVVPEPTGTTRKRQPGERSPRPRAGSPIPPATQPDVST